MVKFNLDTISQMILIRVACNCFQGNIAYARALCKINLLSQEEVQVINVAFKQVLFFKIYIVQNFFQLTLSTLQINTRFFMLSQIIVIILNVVVQYQNQNKEFGFFNQIQDEWDNGKFIINHKDEDIHSANERRLLVC